MGAELVVEPLMGALAEQVEIEVGQQRRKAIGVVQLDHGVAEPRAQAVAIGRARARAGEQAGVVKPLQRGGVAAFVDRLDVGSLRQEGADHGAVVLEMRPEIVERIGMTAFDNGIGFGRQRRHGESPAMSARIRRTPARGTRIHSGRWAISYSIS